MNLRDRLRGFRAPGEDEAGERSWDVVGAAFEQRDRAPRRGRRPRLVAVGAAGLAAVALAVTPAGAEVADWIGEVVDTDESREGPPPLELPAAGRLLVQTGAGPWVVGRDGSKRLLGDYETASWSPQGLFVVVTRGRQIRALEPNGRVRWERTAPAPVGSARWAPSGFRIAYMSGPRSGFEQRPNAEPFVALRIVNGDGTGDRVLRRMVNETPPAWRPGAAHVLAYSGADGRIAVADVDTDRVLWRSTPGERPLQLAWSADGDRLVALARSQLRVFSAEGQELWQTRPRYPAPASIPAFTRGVAFEPDGHGFAVLRRGRGAAEVVRMRAEPGGQRARRLFAAPGGVGGLEWSPDGDWLLIAWDGSDQWVFVSHRDPNQVRTVARIAMRFDAGDPPGPQVPSPAGWCCPP